MAAGFTAAILVLAVGLTIGLRNVHIVISSNDVVSVQLPLHVCPTSVGDPSETPKSLPATVLVEIPKPDSSKLAFYTDNEGLIEIVAPSRWRCSASIAADGSSSVHVSPPETVNDSSGVLSAGSTLQDVSAAQTSACVGCRESLACPLFISAANDYRRAFGHACLTTPPSAEVVTKSTSHLVEFTDPPGVNGDARPSGGANPAMGVMTYFDDVKSDGSWTETCVLPASQTSTCRVIVADFVARYGIR